MKKIAFVILLSAGVGLTGCHKEGPERSAEIFLNGFSHMDFEAAETVSTNETKDVLKMVAQLAPQMVNDSVKAERKKIKVHIESTKVDGDHAVVTYTTSESEAKQKLNLVKQKDEWLVESSKLDQFDEASAENGVMPVQPAETEPPASEPVKEEKK